MPTPQFHARWPLLCALAFAVAPALAQRTEPPTAAPPPPQDSTQTAPRSQALSFRELDVNADGKVSKDEAAVDAQLTRDFAQIDRDGDGQLTDTEYAAGHDRDHY